LRRLRARRARPIPTKPDPSRLSVAGSGIDGGGGGLVVKLYSRMSLTALATEVVDDTEPRTDPWFAKAPRSKAAALKLLRYPLVRELAIVPEAETEAVPLAEIEDVPLCDNVLLLVMLNAVADSNPIGAGNVFDTTSLSVLLTLIGEPLMFVIVPDTLPDADNES